MGNKGAEGPLGATNSGPRPGSFPLGSAQSRAAARAMLVARDSEEQFRVQCYSIVDGQPINFDGLAEAIRAARMKDQAREFPVSLPAIEGGQDYSGGGQADCLAKRIRGARERVARAQALDSTR
jgi:hypothetical protein